MHCTATLHHKKGICAPFYSFLISTSEMTFIDLVSMALMHVSITNLCNIVCKQLKKCSFYHSSSVEVSSFLKVQFGLCQSKESMLQLVYGQ